MSDKHSRTEKATAQKRRKARERGQVFRSREVSGALSFVGAVLAISWLSGWLGSSLKSTMVFFLSGSALTQEPVSETATLAFSRAAWVGIPFLGVSIAASLVGTFAQSPPSISTEPFKPEFKKIFHINKLTQAFSLSGISNLIRGLFGLLAVGLIGYSVLAPEITTIAKLAGWSSDEIARWETGLAISLLYRGAFLYALIAIIDYILNHYKFEKNLRMTKQEVKQEHKELEGDPKVKGRIRRLQQAMAKRRMMSDVAEATVVITNPTHVAVALSYDAVESPAPKVVAKGKGELAARIRDIARKNDVAVYEDPPLARALYAVEVGEVIPAEMYKAVAEVLAYLYRFSRGR